MGKDRLETEWKNEKEFRYCLANRPINHNVSNIDHLNQQIMLCQKSRIVLILTRDDW